jgi:protein tyrosine phosphatase
MLGSNRFFLYLIASWSFFISSANSECIIKSLSFNHDLSSWLRTNSLVKFYEQFYKVTRDEHTLVIEILNLKLLTDRFFYDSKVSINASCFTLFQANLILVDHKKYESVDEFLIENKINDIEECSFNLSLPCSIRSQNLLGQNIKNERLLILSRNEDLLKYSFPSKYQIDYSIVSFNNSKPLLNSIKLIVQLRYSLNNNESYDIFKENFVISNSRLKYYLNSQVSVIDNLNANLVNTSQVFKNSTFISLKWILRDVFSFCNIDYYLIKSTNFLNYETIEIGTDSFHSTNHYKNFCRRAIFSNTTNEHFKSLRINGNRNQPINCLINATADSVFMIECNLQVNALNALYSYTIQAFDQFNMSYWANEISAPIPTDISLPKTNVILEYFKNDFVNHHVTINIRCPQINQNNGTIVSSYLFLVKVGEQRENPIQNYSINFDPHNQKEIVKFLNQRVKCEENSGIFEPCLLNEFDRFGRDGIDFMNTIEICISDKRLNVIESSTFKFLSNKIIKESNYYQFFFIFKMANLYEINKQPTRTNHLFLSSQITQPILISNRVSKEMNKSLIILTSLFIVILFAVIVIIVTWTYYHRKPNNILRFCYMFKRKRDTNNLGNKSDDDKKMTKLCQNDHQTEQEKLRREFEELPEYKNKYTTDVSNDPKNTNKNRYFNVKPYDNNRVTLKKNDGNDYINASFVPGYCKERKFIATQAPLKSTFDDFWLMIDQYNVETIIMLTNLIEHNVSKCDRYWPMRINDAQMYGSIEVTFKSEEVYPDFLQRIYKLVNHEGNKPEKQICQYFFPEWVDKSAPTTDLISIFHLINQVNLKNPGNTPIVIHCSAGVGRTGTYIAIDAMIEMLQSEEKIDVFNFVRKLREKRPSLVQTLSQYVYIHEALNEFKIYGLTDLKFEQILDEVNEANKIERIKSEYEKLSNKINLKTCFENLQFQMESSDLDLSLVKKTYSQFCTASLPSNFPFKLQFGLNDIQKNEFEFFKSIHDTDCNIVVSIVHDVLLVT